MKNIGYVVALAFALYVLTDMVNWQEPKFFDYSMIVIYSICFLLAILNIALYFTKKRG